MLGNDYGEKGSFETVKGIFSIRVADFFGVSVPFGKECKEASKVE